MKNEKHELLSYRLTDMLEMSFSKDKRLLSRVKKKLLSRPIKDSNLYLLPSFVLDQNLVVIQNGHYRKVHQLYLLNSHKGSYREFMLDPR